VRKEIEVERLARVKRILAALSEDGWTRLMPETGPKGPAGTTGAGCRWPIRWIQIGAAGCWSGAA
jgi:hypothetical protein